MELAGADGLLVTVLPERGDWELVARCLEYPDEATPAAARAAAERFRGRAEGLCAALDGLASELERIALTEAEERYTWLFDLKPVCTLHASYHLFGDTYARGELMAALVRELDKWGIDRGSELPDYLPTLLRLLGALDEVGDRALLVHGLLVPALRAMKTPLGKSEAPWAELLRALEPVLEEAAPKVDVPRRRLEVVPC